MAHVVEDFEVDRQYKEDSTGGREEDSSFEDMGDCSH